MSESFPKVDEGCDEAERGNHLRAIELFKSAIDDGEEWAGLNLGNSYKAIGATDLAEVAFDRAWRIGRNADAGFNLASLFEDRGDVARARALFRELIEVGYRKAMDQEAWYARDEGDSERSYSLMLSASQDPGSQGAHSAGVLGTWMWDDSQDFAAKPFLERGRLYFDDAPEALEHLETAENLEVPRN